MPTQPKTFKRVMPTLIPQTLYSVTFTADDNTQKARHIAVRDETHAVRLFRRYFAGSIEKVERLHSCYIPGTPCL
jgi:hypothetical protein